MEKFPEDFIKLIRGKSERWLELASILVIVSEKYPEADDEVIKIVAGANSKFVLQFGLSVIYNLTGN